MQRWISIPRIGIGLMVLLILNACAASVPQAHDAATTPIPPGTTTPAMTMAAPTPSRVSVSELATPTRAAAPTSAHNVAPVSAPRKLSTLRTDVQEQLRWAAAGGAAGSSSSVCPNHPGIDSITGERIREPIDQRLVVGAPPLQQLSREREATLSQTTNTFIAGKTAGIGYPVMFCIDPPKDLQLDDELQIEIVSPDGRWERLSLRYGTFIGSPNMNAFGPEAERLTITNSAGVLRSTLITDESRSLRYIPYDGPYQKSDPYIVVGDHVTYLFPPGAALGIYHIALIINNERIATEPLEVQLCRCPKIAVMDSVPDRSAHGALFRKGATVRLLFTGFPPNETVRLELHKETTTSGTYQESRPYYQWHIQLDQRGEGVDEIAIDTNVPNGRYFLLRADSTTTHFDKCHIGDEHDLYSADLCSGRMGVAWFTIGIPNSRHITGARASASSTLPPEDLTTQGKGIFRYDAQNVLDGNLGQPWVEGVAGPGIGQWIDLTFTEPITLTQLAVSIGFDRSDENFQANNRVRRATLIFADNATQQVTFPDERGLHIVPVADKRTTSLRFVIDDVYPGARFDDTAIGEITVRGSVADS